MPKKKSARPKARNRWKKLLHVVKWALIWWFGVTIFWVIATRFVNPPITWLMLQRGFEQKAAGKPWKIEKNWIDYDELPRNLKLAAMGGEDASFQQHWGFDVKAIEKAYQKNLKNAGREKIRISGGSTISQQTAKNVFLWPGRSWLRKGIEAYFTVLIEIFWGKKRILEVYLNVIEVGDGLYGAQAAAINYFNKPVGELTKAEDALIIAVLPNPRKWSPAKPTRYVYMKQSLILKNMRLLKNAEL